MKDTNQEFLVARELPSCSSFCSTKRGLVCSRKRVPRDANARNRYVALWEISKGKRERRKGWNESKTENEGRRTRRGGKHEMRFVERKLLILPLY